MRKNVDTAELDEVYLEEDDQEGAYGGPLAAPAPTPTPAPAAPAPKTTQLQMVEAPAFKTAAPESSATVAAPAATLTEVKPAENPESAPPPSSNGGPATPPSCLVPPCRSRLNGQLPPSRP